MMVHAGKCCVHKTQSGRTLSARGSCVHQDALFQRAWAQKKHSYFHVICRYLRTGYPAYKLQVKTKDKTGGRACVYQGPGSRLLAQGSSGAATCPCGSGARLLAQGSSGGATCPRGSDSWLGTAPEVPRVPVAPTPASRLGAATCPVDGFYKLQAIKQIFSDDPAIMIFIRACARVSTKTLHDKGCSTRLQGMQQTVH
jgi:hypothetical protein